MVSKVTSRLFYEVATRLQNGISNTIKGFKGDLLKLELDRIVVDFKEEKAQDNWVAICDDVFGGKSTASFEKSKHGQCVFKGNLSTTLPSDDRAIYSGFCAAKSKPNTVGL